jgi:hypothetical protein
MLWVGTAKMETETVRTESSFISAKIQLLSTDGVLYGSVLTLGAAPEDCARASTELPPYVWGKCRDWHEHLEGMWHLLGEEGLKHWQKIYHQLEAEMAEILRQAVLPNPLYGRLMTHLQHQGDGLALIEVCINDEQIDCLPFELLSQCKWRSGLEVVAWRGRTGPVLRKPELRLLAARSAPKDVALPQNEEEIAAIGDYIAHRDGPEIGFRKLGNSPYEEFTEEIGSFCPGVVHLTSHGTLDSFLFNSPPTKDLIGYDSMARYLGRRPFVSTVVSTACFSARPTFYRDKDGICFAKEVVAQGMSAAIGMANKITPRAAEVFCRNLYGELGISSPAVLAYAKAVLAIKEMREYDRLLWSVPVMYARNSNVIPFPNVGYFEVLDQLQNVIDRIEDILSILDTVPSMSHRRRADEAIGISMDVAALLEDLSELQEIELPGTSATAIWRDRLGSFYRTLDWAVGGVASCLMEGEDAGQISSIMKSSLNAVEELVATSYPVAVNR